VQIVTYLRHLPARGSLGEPAVYYSDDERFPKRLRNGANDLQTLELTHPVGAIPHPKKVQVRAHF
jgi:hypothetical protein